jgi:vacuolar-type H+-ATPase subunit E/Vma4
MDEGALERARARITEALQGRVGPGEAEAALERARAGVEALAEATAAIPEAVREGVQAEAAPVARQLAEVRGLAAQMIRRLEHLEADMLAERNARIDDLALLIELIASGWKAVDEKLDALAPPPGGTVYSLQRRRDAS